MGSVIGKTLSVGTTTAPTSADGGFATPVTGYGNEPYNVNNYIPGDFYQIPLINLELTVLSMMNGTGFGSFATLNMTNSSSSTDLVASDTTRSIQVVNTNTTTDNAAGISFRSYATNGAATVQSGAKILTVFTSRTATVLTADLAFLTNNAGTIAERMRITGAGAIVLPVSSPGLALYNLGSDGATNFERVIGVWASNIFTIRAGSGGTGTTRAVRIGTSTAATETMDTYINIQRTSPYFDFVQVGSPSVLANGFVARFTMVNTISSGVATGITVVGTINQTSTAGWTVLDLNPTVTASGTGATNFIVCRKASGSTLFGVDSNGKTNQDATITAGGVTGDQTIDKPTGSVNIAAGGSSIVVTNSTVNANSIITCTIMTNDATAIIKNVVPAAGSFTIRTTAAVTAETKIGFVVHN